MCRQDDDERGWHSDRPSDSPGASQPIAACAATFRARHGDPDTWTPEEFNIYLDLAVWASRSQPAGAARCSGEASLGEQQEEWSSGRPSTAEELSERTTELAAQVREHQERLRRKAQ